MRKPLFSFNNTAVPFHPSYLSYRQTCLVGAIINFKRRLPTFACYCNDLGIYLTEIHWMLSRFPLKMELGGGRGRPTLSAPPDSAEHTKCALLDNFTNVCGLFWKPAPLLPLFIYYYNENIKKSSFFPNK